MLLTEQQWVERACRTRTPRRRAHQTPPNLHTGTQAARLHASTLAHHTCSGRVPGWDGENRTDFTVPECPTSLAAVASVPASLTWQQKSKLDGMDAGKRYVHLPGHTWPDAEEGGASKPSVVFGYA